MTLEISTHGCEAFSEFSTNASSNAYSLQSHIGSIKITIKDKPFTESTKYRHEVLRAAFHSLLFHMKEMKRLNELKAKLQDKLNQMKLQRYFQTWRTKINNKPKFVDKNKNECILSDEQKIKSFVTSIVKNQKNSCMIRKNIMNHRKCMSEPKSRIHTVNSTIQKRLEAQKRIINKQNLKLVEQNQIIESMKLRELENELQHGGYTTLNTAKKALNTCGKKTQHTLLYLMKEGEKSDTSTDSLKPPKCPNFLLRMEKRAEQRRERTRIAREERQRKLEWEKQQEEILRKKQEEKEKRLRLEEQMRMRCILKEQERIRAEQVQKEYIANELARAFYRKYLLKHYIMNPLYQIVEQKYHYLELANNHYDTSLLKKSVMFWRRFVGDIIERKMKLCISVHNNKILNNFFTEWINYTNKRIEIYEETCKYYTMRLRKKCFRFWYDKVHIIKLKSMEDEQLAFNYYRDKLSITYFKRWTKYVKISDQIKDSEKQKDKWRSLVQQVIPSFCPNYRDVLLD